MLIKHNDCIGIVKSSIDAHTMGVNALSTLLEACGYQVVLCPEYVSEAFDKIISEENQAKIIQWLQENNIRHLGISYRLDPGTALELVGRIFNLLEKQGYLNSIDGKIKNIYFSGLKPVCDEIDRLYRGRIITFSGGGLPDETLLKIGVPAEYIPSTITNGSKYDRFLEEFGRKVVEEAKYKICPPLEKNKYSQYGSFNDSLIKRLDFGFFDKTQPLIRAHSGPYDKNLSRQECIRKFIIWCRQLAEDGYLDILSIGTSQLSQSNFGENWANKVNGGGVPINRENEFFDIWKAAQPMLVRTYSGSKNIQYMADVYERNLNMAWHALSLWWFNELDGRGPNSLYKNLCEHVDTIKYIASLHKPFEANVAHHFSFRGADDVTYIIAAFLSAKLAKKCGIETFILQNMLNTPRSTWGVQDLAKSRVMLKLIKELQDDSFRVILQTRAGLDYFKPDIEKSKIQLAAVTALMDDIDTNNIYSPEIIHVVSYSEALYLATPEIVNDSIKITRTALSEYRKNKKYGMLFDVQSDEIKKRCVSLELSVRMIIENMEKEIENLYSPEGLYIAFIAGWLPVPDLWSQKKEFSMARSWKTGVIDGGIHLLNKNEIMSVSARINRCCDNMNEARYIFNNLSI